MATTTPVGNKPKTIYNRATGQHEPNDAYDYAEARRKGERKSFIKQFMDDMKRKYNPTDSRVKRALKKAGV